MMRRYCLGLFLMAAAGAGCSSESMVGIGGYCEVNEDCLSISQHLEGTYCVSGRCTCPAGEELCCPGGKKENCIPGVRNDYKCRPETECHPPEAPDAGAGGTGGGTVGAGGAGMGGSGTGGAGGGGAGPQWECVTDADCPGPVSAVCGVGRCVEHFCGVDVFEGSIASQKYGDCKHVMCDVLGNKIELEDPSDIYNDGNPCTFDYCENGVPVNGFFPNGFLCPEIGAGYCFEGSCVECVATLPYAPCPIAGMECNYVYCVPFGQCVGTCGGLCEPCPPGGLCNTDVECLSNSCAGGMCQLPTCSDGKKNDGETGVDCGSNNCGPCPDGQGCKVPVNCQSGVCMFGKCQAPTCTDGVLNGQESGMDCGGICDPCP